jgi:uncharacterized protein YndB with AHSA1/START domain
MTEVGQELVLELSHRFSAPRDDVFDAWINPEVLKRWWAAAPTWQTPLAEVDAREGGTYRLSMRTDEGKVHTVAGEFTEIRAPERLVYTWAWEPSAGSPRSEREQTLVAVDFIEDGDGTVVRLTHSGFADDETRGMHAQGWEGVLANLERSVFS